jgi:hypothetical protein
VECPRCHTANENGATACINCGLRLIGIDPTKPHPQQVKIVDINMSFMSMVTFMVKWAIASIPAFIILAVMSLIVAGIFIWLSGGLPHIK